MGRLCVERLATEIGHKVKNTGQTVVSGSH